MLTVQEVSGNLWEGKAFSLRSWVFFQSCTVCRVVKHVWHWGFPLQFKFQAVVALEKPCEDSGVRHYFWKSSSSNKIKITINAPSFLARGWQPGPNMLSSHLHSSGVKVYVYLLLSSHPYPWCLSVSSSDFNQQFLCFLYPEETQKHWFPSHVYHFVGVAWSFEVSNSLLSWAELGIWLVPPPHSQFQTEVGKPPCIGELAAM